LAHPRYRLAQAAPELGKGAEISLMRTFFSVGFSTVEIALMNHEKSL
jgi:hypothetical protein